MYLLFKASLQYLIQKDLIMALGAYKDEQKFKVAMKSSMYQKIKSFAILNKHSLNCEILSRLAKTLYDDEQEGV